MPVPSHVDGRVLWELLADAQGEPGEQQDEVVGPERSAAGLTDPQLQLHWVGATSYLHGALQPDTRYPWDATRMASVK
ncbi:MAG: hypothetical protein KatS3mg050_0601 [Litorilinea sp.]|nr:MAG: hypothetical protein KatS3mg050_0601 [Litorilinea sp.]